MPAVDHSALRTTRCWHRSPGRAPVSGGPHASTSTSMHVPDEVLLVARSSALVPI